jgi:hypothetical protein
MLIVRSNGGRMLPQLSPWDVNGALARTSEAAAAALQQLLTRELAEWKGLALAVLPRCVSCVVCVWGGHHKGDGRRPVCVWAAPGAGGGGCCPYIWHSGRAWHLVVRPR